MLGRAVKGDGWELGCLQHDCRCSCGAHLLAILVKVVEPEDISTWRTRFSKALRPSSSTRRKACAGAERVGRERCQVLAEHVRAVLLSRTWAV